MSLIKQTIAFRAVFPVSHDMGGHQEGQLPPVGRAFALQGQDAFPMQPEHIGSREAGQEGEPFGRMGLGHPPLAESKPLRDRIIFMSGFLPFIGFVKYGVVNGMDIGEPVRGAAVEFFMVA